MKKNMKATNIQWETDGEDVDLPDEIEIPDEYVDEDGVDYEGIADYISDVTGWLHSGFVIEE